MIGSNSAIFVITSIINTYSYESFGGFFKNFFFKILINNSFDRRSWRKARQTKARSEEGKKQISFCNYSFPYFTIGGQFGYICCISISEMGLLEDDENLVKFVTGLISISDEIILLVDHSKFYQNEGSFIICPLDSIDTIITEKMSTKVQNFQKKFLKAITIAN